MNTSFGLCSRGRREYDGKSNVGEFVENTNEFTEEELDFMDAHNPIVDVSLVDVSYAETLENELYHLRNSMAQLQMNNQILFNEYNMLLSSNRKNCDIMDKWASLAHGNQMARLRRSILGEFKPLEEGEIKPEVHYVPNTSEMSIDELDTSDENDQLVEVGF